MQSIESFTLLEKDDVRNFLFQNGITATKIDSVKIEVKPLAANEELLRTFCYIGVTCGCIV
ncbi:MAG: hypothetical protein IJ630_10095 [Treponema sp.]|nr:hypothetical protein [Treponema sp.]